MRKLMTELLHAEYRIGTFVFLAKSQTQFNFCSVHLPAVAKSSRRADRNCRRFGKTARGNP